MDSHGPSRTAVLTPPEEKPTAAAVLSMVGGALVVAGGFAELAYAAYLSNLGNFAFGTSERPAGGIYYVLGGLGILLGIVIVVLGTRLLSHPDDNVTMGVLVIVFAVVSLASFWGGFVVGFPVAVVGGVLAVLWKPEERVEFASLPPASPPT